MNIFLYMCVLSHKYWKMIKKAMFAGEIEIFLFLVKIKFIGLYFSNSIKFEECLRVLIKLGLRVVWNTFAKMKQF